MVLLPLRKCYMLHLNVFNGFYINFNGITAITKKSNVILFTDIRLTSQSISLFLNIGNCSFNFLILFYFRPIDPHEWSGCWEWLLFYRDTIY